MEDVYVVQVAATGPRWCPEDEVAEIAICKVLPDGSDFETVYNDGIALDPMDLGKAPLDYMSSEFGIEPEDLYAGSELVKVVSDFQRIVFGRQCTSYNIANVFGKHLSFEPWDAARNLTILPSVSCRLPSELKGPADKEHDLIRRAYEALCPGDPAEVGEGCHALHLAQMTAEILCFLKRNGMARRSESHIPDGRSDDQVGKRRYVGKPVYHEERDGEDPGDHGDDHREYDRRKEHCEPEEQEEGSALLSHIQLSYPEQAEQTEDGVEDERDLRVAIPRTGTFRGYGFGLHRDLLVAFRTGDAVARHELSAVRAASVGQIGPSLERMRCTGRMLRASPLRNRP